MKAIEGRQNINIYLLKCHSLINRNMWHNNPSIPDVCMCVYTMNKQLLFTDVLNGPQLSYLQQKSVRNTFVSVSSETQQQV